MATPWDLVRNGLDIAPKVLNLGESLFAGDQAWMDYKREVRRLQRTLESYKEIIGDFEFEAPVSVTEALMDAEDELDRAHKRLQDIERCGCCLSLTCSYAFPKALKERTQFLKELPQEIKNLLADGEEFKKQVESAQAGKLQIESNIPPLDGRFVLWKDYQQQIYAALKDTGDDAPLVVFLYGEQGIGKTTIAWHTAADARKTHGNQEASLSLSSFRDVLFIPCGPSVGSDDVEAVLKSQLRLGVEANSTDISKVLMKMTMLVILDDVQDSNIPKQVIKWGGHSRKGLKFFITSNLDTLCDNCDFSKIHKIRMHNIPRDYARQVLASHSSFRLPMGQIPDKLKGVVKIMDEVIDKTRGNLLALACFASVLRKDRTEDLREWENALTIFHDTLKRESKLEVYQNYPYSFWGMMQVHVESLDADAKILLLLVSTLVLESIPEETIQSLYVHDRFGLGNQKLFADGSVVLKEKHLITITGRPTCDGYASYTWAMHPLKKHFVEKEGVGGRITEEVQREHFQSRSNEGSVAKTNDMGQFIKKKLTDDLRVYGKSKDPTVLVSRDHWYLCVDFVDPRFVPAEISKLCVDSDFEMVASNLNRSLQIHYWRKLRLLFYASRRFRDLIDLLTQEEGNGKSSE